MLPVGPGPVSGFVTDSELRPRYPAVEIYRVTAMAGNPGAPYLADIDGLPRIDGGPEALLRLDERRRLSGRVGDDGGVLEESTGTIIGEVEGLRRLVDEARSLTLFGGRRWILVSGAGDETLEAAQLLIAEAQVEHPVVILGPGLRTTSKLTQFAVGEPAAMSFACYIPDGANAERMVVGIAREQGLRFVGAVVAVAVIAKQERRSLEEAARIARYAFLRRVAKEVGATRICVGHTRDDQAETLLMRMFRGSGIAGLAAMARETEREGVRLARPFLNVSKSQLVATLKKGPEAPPGKPTLIAEVGGADWSVERLSPRRRRPVTLT